MNSRLSVANTYFSPRTLLFWSASVVILLCVSDEGV